MGLHCLLVVVAILSSVIARDVNVLIIGSAGSGKSSLVSNIGGFKDISAFRAVPVTNEITKYQVEFRVDGEDVDLNLIDTMGFASTDSTENIVKKMEAIILNPSIVQSIHRVVVLFKAERNNPAALEDLKHILSVLSAIGLEGSNILSYVTHMDIYDKNTKSLMEQAISAFYSKDSKDIKFLLQPISKCFASADQIDDELKPFYEKWIRRDIKEFLLRVTKKVMPFYPSDYKACAPSWFNVIGVGYTACLEEKKIQRQKGVKYASGPRIEL